MARRGKGCICNSCWIRQNSRSGARGKGGPSRLEEGECSCKHGRQRQDRREISSGDLPYCGTRSDEGGPRRRRWWWGQWQLMPADWLIALVVDDRDAIKVATAYYSLPRNKRRDLGRLA